jgi:acetolactate synthase-1/2/3 large subunit
VKRYDKIPDAMRRAFRLATSGRPGAVHLAFPQEVLSSVVPGGERDVYAEPACRSYPTYRARAERAELDKAVELLLAARRPVFIAGGGVINARAWGELDELAELLGAAVGTTITGKGAIPESHPLAIGVVGDNGYREYANEQVARADLLFYIGCKTGSVTTVKWTLPEPHRAPTVLHLDIDANLIGNNYPTAVGLVGDAQLILADLVALVRRRQMGEPPSPEALEAAAVLSRGPAGQAGNGAKPDLRAEIAAGREAWWTTVGPKMASEEMPLKPHRVMAALRRVLPEDAIVVADAGTPTPYVSAYYEVGCPGRHVIIPRAYGGLGYAIPAVVGAKIARPEQLVVGLSGDGSFAMSAGELETIGRLDLPVVLLNFNNSCFGWIKALQSIHLDGRYLGVDFSPTDYAAVARAFGIRGLRLERASDLEELLAEAASSGRPTLIDIPSESEEKDLPQMKLWRDAAAKKEARRAAAGAVQS